ncbi:MAG TPA: HAD family hydrolase [Sphingobium sp.]
MNRPLIITDCDEVLLHMVVPFRAWLDETHDVHFDMRGQEFTDALRHKSSGVLVERELIWTLLVEFFDTAMDRQLPITGALEALASLSEVADIEVLTNIGEAQHLGRIEQLRKLGVHHRVHWNQGGKGPPLAAIVADRKPSIAFFIDDLGIHHRSVAEHAPDVWRLHMIGEPEIAEKVPSGDFAHARIDDWASAEVWIRERIAEGRPQAA